MSRHYTRKYRRKQNHEWLHPVVSILGTIAIWVDDFFCWVGKKLGLTDGSADAKDGGGKIKGKITLILPLVE